MQYIRKVTGVTRPTGDVASAMEEAAAEVAEVTARVLALLPSRRQPPKTVPPLRRPEVRQRMGLGRSRPEGRRGGDSQLATAPGRGELLMGRPLRRATSVHASSSTAANSSRSWAAR